MPIGQKAAQLPPPKDPPPSSATAPPRAAAGVASAASVTSITLQTHTPNKANVPTKQVRELEEGEVEESDEEQDEVPPSTGTPRGTPRGGSRLTRPPAVNKAAQKPPSTGKPKPSSLPASGTKRPRSPARPSRRLGPTDSRAKDSKQKAPETGPTTDCLVKGSAAQNYSNQSPVVRRGEINDETVKMLAPAARVSNTNPGACLSTGQQEKDQLKPRLRPGKNARRRKQALEKTAEKEKPPIASSLTSQSLLQRAHHPAIAQQLPPSPPHPQSLPKTPTGNSSK